MQNTSERYWNLGYQFKEFKERMYLWKLVLNKSSKNIMLGGGFTAYRSFGISTPHNVFVSLVITSGILGTFFFILLILFAFRSLLSDSDKRSADKLNKLLLAYLVLLLLILATNDFSGGRYISMSIIISAVSKIEMLRKTERIKFTGLKDNING